MSSLLAVRMRFCPTSCSEFVIRRGLWARLIDISHVLLLRSINDNHNEGVKISSGDHWQIRPEHGEGLVRGAERY